MFASKLVLFVGVLFLFFFDSSAIFLFHSGSFSVEKKPLTTKGQPSDSSEAEPWEV